MQYSKENIKIQGPFDKNHKTIIKLCSLKTYFYKLEAPHQSHLNFYMIKSKRFRVG